MKTEIKSPERGSYHIDFVIARLKEIKDEGTTSIWHEYTIGNIMED